MAPMGVYADAGVFGFDLPAGVWGGYLLPLGLVALSWFGERTVGRRSRRVVCAGVGGVLAFGVSETAMGLSAVVWLVSGVASGTG
ncbi:hypothetical protein [Streptomyces clavuligerus]|uniref:hypothetical protein n=1 Tax=Streptomyces clavuligerus TaxID=1901 RepID=UPI0002DC0DAF|nr:hypothetical protein [Streptomyces clavuligerus]WDN53217.1 hypothetical protein LL058_15965 [Streptomyces clavuligerus]